MNVRRILSWACVLALLTAPLGVSAAGAEGVVLYDGESGETLEELLAEDAVAWPTVTAPIPTDDLQINAKSAVLMDQAEGRVLYEKNAYEHLPIASVTKVMTLLLVMEAIDAGRLHWEDAVTCSAVASSMGGSQIWLEVGEVMTVEQLVKAAAVVSANDACVALAEHMCGTVAAFVSAMNGRAVELGMENTLFKDCSGLDDTGYSCAYDVAVMSRELMTHKDIQRFTTVWMDSLRDGKSQLVNTNKLVRHYQGATGLKTGTTQAAGHCLAATADREGTAFVAVVLGSATTADRFNGARAMLDYGFANYISYTPPVEQIRPEPIPVIHGQAEQVAVTADVPGALLLRKGQESSADMAVELAENLEAPVEAGQIVGTCRLKVGDEVLCEFAIRAAEAVPRMDFRYAYYELFSALLR